MGQPSRARWTPARAAAEPDQPEGLPSACVANLDNIRTAARRWFDSKAGALAPSRHWEVKRALGYALGWDELIDLP